MPQDSAKVSSAAVDQRLTNESLGHFMGRRLINESIQNH